MTSKSSYEFEVRYLGGKFKTELSLVVAIQIEVLE